MTKDERNGIMTANERNLEHFAGTIVYIMEITNT